MDLVEWAKTHHVTQPSPEGSTFTEEFKVALREAGYEELEEGCGMWLPTCDIPRGGA